MTEVLSVGLGGGGWIKEHEVTETIKVGPESVGHRLTTHSLDFSGDVMTSTDILVASGAYYPFPIAE
jgi:N-methylhydantoinase A/oxoprolinase/acetone carboxylase beta subunit